MNETHILIFGFVITFGLLGYKLKGMVCKFLDDYSKKIESELNQSELMKKQSINELDKANKNADEIQKVIIREKEDAQKKLEIIRQNIDTKAQNTINTINKNKQTRMSNEIDIMTSDVKKNISILIANVVDFFVKKSSNIESSDVVKVKLMDKVDIKKLLN